MRGVWVGMVVTRVGCDVCPCDPCDRVCPVCPLCVPAPPGIFLPVPVLFCTGVSRLPPVSFVTGTGTVLYRDFYRCVPAPPGVFEPVPVLYRYESNLVRRVVMAENARRGPEEFTVPRPT